MPPDYRVILLMEAASDLDQIASYISQTSPQNAVTVCERIISAVNNLSLMPKRFRYVGRSRKRGSPVHSLVVRPYIIYYRIEEQSRTVAVLTVRHGARIQPRTFD